MNSEEHKNLGIQYFNKTWEYIDLEDRTKEQNLEMLHYVHSSRLHWELSGAPVLNLVRGDWQISTVYCLLNQGELALQYAKSCHDKTINNNIGDFDLVFAHEIMAKSYKVLNDFDNVKKHLELAYQAIDQISDIKDKNYCIEQIDKI